MKKTLIKAIKRLQRNSQQSQMPGQINPNMLDCTGQTCKKCGGPLTPMASKSGQTFCGCSLDDRQT